MRYDSKNNLIETILPDNTPDDLNDNSRVGVTYDAEGNRTSISGDGRTTNYTQDSLGRPTGMILADNTPGDSGDNPRTTVEYDKAGRMTALIDQSGNRTEYEYDAAGRMTGARTVQGNESSSIASTFDAVGREVTRTNALGQTTELTYDKLDQLTKTIYPDGTSVQTVHNRSGNVVSTTNQLGQTTTYEYDVLDRLTGVADPTGQRTAYNYDEAGNLVKQTDALGRVTRFEYDGVGRIIATVRPLGQRSETIYDAIGRVIKTTDFNSNVITYQYDALNQLVLKSLLSEDITIKFTYGDNKKRESVTDEHGTTLYDYNVEGRLLSRTDSDGVSVSYTYYNSGLVNTITTQSGTTTYQYNDSDQLSEVIEQNGNKTTYVYDSIGNLTLTERPNGTTQRYEYNSLSQVAYQENSDRADNLIASYRYTYDKVGNKTVIEENTGRRMEYVYDNLNRLIGESIVDPKNGNRIISYTFDSVGNRLTKNDSVAGLTVYTYDDNDQLLQEEEGGITTAYRYDENGNLIEKLEPETHTIYRWNSQNRLVEAEIVDSTGTKQIEYSYDADGVRVEKVVDGNETRYLVDTNRQYAQVLEEYDANKGANASYIYGSGELISQHREEVSSYYLHDAHSGIRTLTDKNSGVTDSYLYDSYGNILQHAGSTDNSYLYRGEATDGETGLQYLRARYNDTNLGRLISTDAFPGVIDSPASRHRYTYAYNNPLTYIDPSGHIGISSTSATFALMKVLEGLTLAGLVFAPAQLLGSQFAGISGDSIPWWGVKSSLTGFGNNRLLLSQGLGGDIYTTKTEFSDELGSYSGYGALLAIHANYGRSLLGGNGLDQPFLSIGNFDVKTPLAFGRSIFSLGGGYMSLGVSASFAIGLGPAADLDALSIGYGRGTSSGFGAVFGTGDASVELQLGISIPLYHNTERRIRTPQPS